MEFDPLGIHKKDQQDAAMRQMSDLMASYYHFLIAAGFTEDQAFHLTSNYHNIVVESSIRANLNK